MKLDRSELEAAAARLREALLAQRTPGGHWEGELSSSALATATATFALGLVEQQLGSDPARRTVIAGGLRWLVDTQCADGGWGDTVSSRPNISTTALCWATLAALQDGSESHRAAVARAQGWLSRAAGGTDPARLAAAITRRYGKDKTFSVPILTMCALAGQLGPGRDAWRRVAQLPFEVAALPASLFRWLQLPVVSYALPALIAIGQVRHARRPTRNLALRALRDRARAPTLRVLEEILPESGGFLEAIPLTAFVVMSLVSCGEASHRVSREGTAFLLRTVRADGSWPIDVNLATWGTTLSINALTGAAESARHLSPGEREQLRSWLLDQQLQREHPFTHAAPGGWGWTNLTGSVPDADDTAGALLALRHLGTPDPRTRAAARRGVRWLLDLQNRDGGMPTFCHGWGALPFDRSGADLTAHALLAWSAWMPFLPEDQARLREGIARALRYLTAQQRPDGSWTPLWFGNEHAVDEANPTYGTGRVLLALQALRRAGVEVKAELETRATQWLLAAQHADGGWGAGRGTPSSIEETGIALQALAAIDAADAQAAVVRGTAWLIRRTTAPPPLPSAPIGFYFANLWYSEALYPYIFAVGAFERVLASVERFVSRTAGSVSESADKESRSGAAVRH